MDMINMVLEKAPWSTPEKPAFVARTFYKRKVRSTWYPITNSSYHKIKGAPKGSLLVGEFKEIDTKKGTTTFFEVSSVKFLPAEIRTLRPEEGDVVVTFYEYKEDGTLVEDTAYPPLNEEEKAAVAAWVEANNKWAYHYCSDGLAVYKDLKGNTKSVPFTFTISSHDGRYMEGTLVTELGTHQDRISYGNYNNWKVVSQDYTYINATEFVAGGKVVGTYYSKRKLTVSEHTTEYEGGTISYTKHSDSVEIESRYVSNGLSLCNFL